MIRWDWVAAFVAGYAVLALHAGIKLGIAQHRSPFKEKP